VHRREDRRLRSRNLNSGPDPALAIITVTDVPLVDAAGAPIATRPLPIVATLAACDKPDGQLPETCKELFINVEPPASAHPR
jgi:hypothetical protein